MKSKIRSLIIDDEPPARDLLSFYLNNIDYIEVAGTCSNGLDALKMIRETDPELLFLDIQMPRISGLELLELLDKKPEVIFCTAYDEYAIRAFEMNAADYLLKPFSEERLQQAVSRAALRIRKMTPSDPGRYNSLSKTIRKGQNNPERIIAKTGTNITVIPLDTVHYLEAQDDYVMVVSDLGNHLKDKTMKYYEEILPSDTFVRIHRSYIVNIRRIKSISLYGKESYRVILDSGVDIRASAKGYKLLKGLL